MNHRGRGSSPYCLPVSGEARTFRLDEYATAGREFIGDAIHALAIASSPILAQIAVEEAEAVPVSRNTLGDGQVIDHDPYLIGSTVTMSISEGIAGNFDGLHAAIAEMGASFVSQVVPRLLQLVSDLCDATGNVVNGAAQSLWESYLQALETMAISFDSAGLARLPQVAINPAAANTIPPPPDDFHERLNSILDRRRDEWLATRRSRRLPRDRH
jgi:hypothetical protein